jgi:hypothetical protein
MSPELEEKLGKAMAAMAIEENKRMAQSLGSSYANKGLRNRLARQQQGKSGGRPKKSKKELEIERLKKRLEKLEEQK